MEEETNDNAAIAFESKEQKAPESETVSNSIELEKLKKYFDF